MQTASMALVSISRASRSKHCCRARGTLYTPGTGRVGTELNSMLQGCHAITQPQQRDNRRECLYPVLHPFKQTPVWQPNGIYYIIYKTTKQNTRQDNKNTTKTVLHKTTKHSSSQDNKTQHMTRQQKQNKTTKQDMRTKQNTTQYKTTKHNTVQVNKTQHKTVQHKTRQQNTRQ